MTRPCQDTVVDHLIALLAWLFALARCLNRARRGKLQVVITEGNIRPVVPLVAAKFASECNYTFLNDNDEELNEFDLFKELHHSRKKKCYTPIVQEAITRMENKLSTTTEGATQIVADVLAENTKKNQFLKNVEFQNARPRSSEESTEIELEAEKRANAELRAQVADLLNKMQESEQARIMDREEMRRNQCEMEAKLNLLFSQI